MYVLYHNRFQYTVLIHLWIGVHSNHKYVYVATYSKSISVASTNVSLEVCTQRKLCLAIGTRKGLFTSVGTQMSLQS